MVAPEDIYNRIKSAVRPTCEREESVESIAINIYLTAMGVRPATMPFDTEGHDVMLKRYKENPSVGKKLKAIPGIDVKIGPYFDSGDVIVVFNTAEHRSFVESRMRRLEEIAATTNRQQHADLHIVIGELLGYICPSAMESLWSGDIDDISFVIDGIDYMGVWCRSSRRFTTRAKELLGQINAALKHIGKHATLVIKKKGSRGQTRKQKNRKRVTRRREQ